MNYPTLPEHFNLDIWNSNFLELYNEILAINQYNTKITETPTPSNLGTVTTILAIRNGGSVRFKLNALCGTWTLGTTYELCTLSLDFRPETEFDKVILLGGVNTQIAYLFITTDGKVYVQPRVNMSPTTIFIDETFII